MVDEILMQATSSQVQRPADKPRIVARWTTGERHDLRWLEPAVIAARSGPPFPEEGCGSRSGAKRPTLTRRAETLRRFFFRHTKPPVAYRRVCRVGCLALQFRNIATSRESTRPFFFFLLLLRRHGCVHLACSAHHVSPLVHVVRVFGRPVFASRSICRRCVQVLRAPGTMHASQYEHESHYTCGGRQMTRRLRKK
jgi:hypothetical protein